ncbi:MULTISPECIES: c-type cytochrome [Cobetia]|nr:MULTISPECIES: c-type cytochrome [Cobetia]
MRVRSLPASIALLSVSTRSLFMVRRSLMLSVCLAGSLLGTAYSTASLAADNSREAIAERLKPVGELCLKGEACAGDTSAAGAQQAEPSDSDQDSTASADATIDGEKVYGGICMACHTTGAAGAPRLGEASDWEARLSKGTDTLYGHAINGFNAMPAKGGNPALSDDEVKAAVDYLLDSVR